MWKAFCVMVVVLSGLPALAQTTNQTPTSIGTTLMYKGWPFLDLVNYECQQSLKTGREIGFACELVNQGKELQVFIGDFFLNDEVKAKKSKYDRLDVVAKYILAGGTDVVFVDVTKKPPLSQSCVYGKQRGGFQCNDWREWK